MSGDRSKFMGFICCNKEAHCENITIDRLCELETRRAGLTQPESRGTGSQPCAPGVSGLFPGVRFIPYALIREGSMYNGNMNKDNRIPIKVCLRGTKSVQHLHKTINPRTF